MRAPASGKKCLTGVDPLDFLLRFASGHSSARRPLSRLFLSLFGNLDVIAEDKLHRNELYQGYTNGLSGLNLNPISAFYESVTPALDTASSIAAKTPVLLDAAGKGLSVASLTARDLNLDGKLTGAEFNWVDWAPTQVKVNYNNKSYLIGTDGADNFDANYYNYAGSPINSGLLTNFLAGGGNDVFGGSARADNLWGGLGNDTAYGYTGDDKLFYGEEGNDKLLGGTGNDKLFGQVGDDILWGNEGDDVLVGFTPSNHAKQTLNAGETDNDRLFGGAGNDFILGGLGGDVLYGETGTDKLQGGDGNNNYLLGGLGSKCVANDAVFEIRREA